jgi:hypothetical protein
LSGKTILEQYGTSADNTTGLAAMYEGYRTLTDSLFASLCCRKLAIDTDAGQWPAYYMKIARVLEAAHVRV